MGEDLQIKPLTKAALRKAIDKNTFWKTPLVPLPKSKAIWLLDNPRIEEEDYCGVLGLEKEKLVAFVFMFPDWLNLRNNKKQKVYWELLWWTHHNYVNTILGSYIFNEAVKLAKKKIIIKSYAENVNEFYEKQPFNIIDSRLRYTLFFGVNAEIVKGRFSFLKHFGIIVKLLEGFSTSVLRIINKFKIQKTRISLSYEYINQLDAATWNFIAPLCANDLIYKTKDYVNWQLNKFQYTQIPTTEKKQYNSLYTGEGKGIRIHNVKIIKENRIIGFLSYVVNHKEFNIKYFMVSDNANYSICVDAVMEHFILSKANFIFTDDTKLSEKLNNKYTTVFIYKKEKKALIHKSIELEKDLALKIYNRDGHFY